VITALRRLHLRRIASLRLRNVIAVVAVAAGSSLALAVIIVTSSVSHSLSTFGQREAGAATIRVIGATSSGGIDFATLSKVEITPGVADAVPIVQAVSEVHTATGPQTVVIIGVTCNAASLVGSSLCSSGQTTIGANTIVVSTDLSRRLSSSSWIETDRTALPLADAVATPQLNSFNNGDAVIMPILTAQEFFDRTHRVDDIYVVPDKGTSTPALELRLTRAVRPLAGVVNANASPPEVQQAIGSFIPLLALLAILASAVAGVLVYNIVTLSLEERRRQQAIIAAVGAPPSVMLLGPLLEAVILGAVGGLIGAVGGSVLAHPVVSSISALTLQYVGLPIAVHTTSITYVVGFLLGGLIGVGAAIRPALRTRKADIAAELSARSQRERGSLKHAVRTTFIFLILSVVSMIVCWLGGRNGSLQMWQPMAAIVGFLAGAIFMILTIGSAAPLIIRSIGSREKSKLGLWRLGGANLVREPGRTSTMTIAVGASLGIALVVGSYSHSIDIGTSHSVYSSSAGHSIEVVPEANENGFNTDARIPMSAVTRLASLPGVADEERFEVQLVGVTASDLLLVEGTNDLSGHTTVYAGSAATGPYLHGEVLVGTTLARRDHLHAGSRLSLQTPTSTVSVPVEGIWAKGNSNGQNVTMSLSLEDRLFGPQLPSGLELIVKRGYSFSEITAEARSVHLAPFLLLWSPQKVLTNSVSNISGQLSPFWALQRALLLVAFISVLSTLLLVGVQRRREFGLLGAVGFGPGDLFAMVTFEAGIVGLIGSVLGTGLGLALLWGLLQALPIFVGFHNTYYIDMQSLLIYVPIVLFTTVGAAIWPGWKAAKLPILEALQYE